MRRITSYQAFWRPQNHQGHFWFTYFDGDRERTDDLDAESFKAMLQVLNTDKPVFGDHTTSSVAVDSQSNGFTTGTLV